MTAISQLQPRYTSALMQSTARTVRVYFREAKYELLKLMRLPAFFIPTLGFPMMFYALFGLLLPQAKSGFDISQYLLATYGASVSSASHCSRWALVSPLNEARAGLP